MMQSIEFPWSDNWWIEKDKAWFCAGEMAALFCVDMNNLQCELITRIPECDFNNFRMYSYCMKYGNKILCLPNIGKCIWCYDLKSLQWQKIEVGNEYQLTMCRSFYRKSKDRIYSWNEEGIVYEVNLAKSILEKKYNIPKKCGGEIGEYILVENELYCVCGRYVNCIDLDTKEIVSYAISVAQADLYTICFDGENFWLSGFCKEVYVWNPKQGVTKILTEFPKWFGIYDFSGNQMLLIDCNSFITTEYPFFYSSVQLGDYVWFIPFQTNEILYINKETYEIFVLDIEGELETRESLKMHQLSCKYLVEYIREERYIGLYSLKNRCIFEIDTIELCIRDRNYYLSDEDILTIAREKINYKNRKVLRENRKMDRMFYSLTLKEDTREKDKIYQDIGKNIYSILSEQ